ncbi:APC family permease [Micromonospora sp. DT81.3]|uniref:APC family permease n=1 Tax=Micromonospora sp. DT81.3 TaxID=3416523 RepID=UPI003CF007E4
MHSQPALLRRLGLADAVFLGLGSMIGAGVFAAFAPAAAAAGTALLIGLALAAIVAFCNATASAQLAAAHPTSGGTYAYGRAELGPWWGFVAGWCFVIGKLASCAAMALTFAAYAAPPGWERPVAVVAVAALAAVNYFGITRTALLTRIIVVFVLMTLAVVVAAGIDAEGIPDVWRGVQVLRTDAVDAGAYGILQSAGLLFFAFAGYARIATLGEEVRDPRRTIPRAIVLSLGIAVGVYGVIALTVLATLGPAGTAVSLAPLADTAASPGWPWAEPLVRVGAAAASLGALLALIAGIGRTSLAMAREDDLPRYFAAVHPRWRVPHRAEVAVALLVIAAVLLVDLRGAIAFSSFGVLIYYFIANVAAWRQAARARLYPRALQALGAAGCVALVVTLPTLGVIVGALVVLVGIGYRAIRLWVQARR